MRKGGRDSAREQEREGHLGGEVDERAELIEPETRNPELETQKPEPELRNPESETQNPKTQVCVCERETKKE